MSKASEWAAYMRARPRPYLDENFLEARVNDYGDMELESGVKAYSPDRALRLAHWIIDTFGEDFSATRRGGP